MDAANGNRPSLPPIQFIDSDKYRHEEQDYQTRHTEFPATSVASSTVIQAPYPAGPPPPYSAATQPAIHTPTAPSHPHTPDVISKRQELRELPSASTKASLPSLHEALGVDRHTHYSTEPTPSSATTQTSHPAPSTHSPQSPRRSQNGPSPTQRPHTFAPMHVPYPQAEQSAIRSTVSDPHEQRRHEWPEHHRTVSQNNRSPTLSGAPQPRHAYPVTEPARHYETSPHGAAGSSQFPYGYATSHPAYTSGPPAPTAAAPAYPPGHPLAASEPQTWRSAAPAAPLPPQRPQAYGESVKRHLDLYDFELALNEIAEMSTVTLDFSRSYGARLHQTQRSGIVPGTLPAITEVDDLMNKSRNTLEALAKMREVLVAQQTLYFQQAQEQHLRHEDLKRNDSIHQQDESKAGGFAGMEPKKRRGRNAAPGRCHSCNRAETPEWRRGPDGARTLCNACGLHYAKLTRKAGANKAAIGSSSLRPKAKEADGSEA